MENTFCDHTKPENKIDRRKWNIRVWAIFWNDDRSPALLCSALPFILSLLFFSKIGLSFFLQVYLSIYLFLSLFPCCCCCCCCFFIFIARLHTKTWITQILILNYLGFAATINNLITSLKGHCVKFTDS